MELAECLHQFLCQKGKRPGETHAVSCEHCATLPAGCTSPSVHGTTYYLCGNTWFQPSYGANGVYYRVVPEP